MRDEQLLADLDAQHQQWAERMAAPAPAGYKHCTCCGTAKPQTLEYFPPVWRHSDGLGSWCRECVRRYERWRQPEKRRHKRSTRAMRRAVRQIAAERGLPLEWFKAP